MTWSIDELEQAHLSCFGNYDTVTHSEQCGCFHCLRWFTPDEVVDWIVEEGDTGDTAVCPSCGIDSVLGDKSGLPIDEAVFLRAMKRHFFSEG